MRFWLTTHYPHYPADNANWFIYVSRGREKWVHDFNEGDRVAFYEVARGVDRIGVGRRPRGLKGIRCLAVACAVPRAATFQEAYVNGKATDFTLECPCSDHDFTHSLPMDAFFDALGRRLALIGIGGRAEPLREDEFMRLETAFLRSPRG